jgi:hypothetical protein
VFELRDDRAPTAPRSPAIPFPGRRDAWSSLAEDADADASVMENVR